MKKDQTDDHLQEPRNVQQTIAVLPWMRNPLNVESYDPVPLQKVVGLHPRYATLMATFVLSIACRQNETVETVCLTSSILGTCSDYLYQAVRCVA